MPSRQEGCRRLGGPLSRPPVPLYEAWAFVRVIHHQTKGVFIVTGDQNHLVIGGTGRVGQEVLRALIARGLSPRALVRSEARAAALPEGAVPVVGDLSDRASLERAIDGIDGVFFITPHHDEDEAWGHNVLDVCEAAGVSRVVFSTAHHPDSSNRLAMKMIFVFLGLVLPHYKSKWKIEARVRSLAMNWNVLMPSNFYQNDAMFREQILGGVYPPAARREGVQPGRLPRRRSGGGPRVVRRIGQRRLSHRGARELERR